MTNTNSQATVIFYILDQGLVQNGASVASILNRVATNRMSAILGVEVGIILFYISYVFHSCKEGCPSEQTLFSKELSHEM